jgi:hypothetical protein
MEIHTNAPLGLSNDIIDFKNPTIFNYTTKYKLKVWSLVPTMKVRCKNSKIELKWTCKHDEVKGEINMHNPKKRWLGKIKVKILHK